MNGDILGKILQYLILPSFTWCYENGEKDKLLRGTENSSENIIDGVLNKVNTPIVLILFRIILILIIYCYFHYLNSYIFIYALVLLLLFYL